MSPLPRAVQEVGRQSVGVKGQPWNVTSSDFFNGADRVRTRVGQLLSTTPENIALIPSASYGLSTASAILSITAGQRVILLGEQFPSNVYPWLEMARQHQGEVVTIPRPADGDWTTPLLSEIDGRTAVVAIPQCHWSDGALIDVAEVSRKTHQVGAALVLDLTQSLGALPFSVEEIDPDVVVCAAYKWMLGPYSTGFMYLARKHQQGIPLEQTWLGRRGSEDFSGLVEYVTEYQPGAIRFDVGERANFILVPMLERALDLILDWTPAHIAETLEQLTASVAERATDMGLATVPKSVRAPHFTGLRFPSRIPELLPDKLREANVYVSIRGKSIRVSPHLYNSEQDIARLFDVLHACHLPSG